jgi:Putative restriction endonuclease
MFLWSLDVGAWKGLDLKQRWCNEHLTPALSPFCSADSAKRGEGETLPASCQIMSLDPCQSRIKNSVKMRPLELLTVIDSSWLSYNSVTVSNNMSRPYEEVLDGATLPRSAPSERHEQILQRLHREMAIGINGLATTRLLEPRTQVQVSRITMLCPDLALVTAASGKLFLAVEIINRDDHRADTVTKKDIYEQIRVPRLWVVDPRYDNVEIYHSFEFGLKLQGILAGSEVLTDRIIPQFKLTVAELFAASP